MKIDYSLWVKHPFTSPDVEVGLAYLLAYIALSLCLCLSLFPYVSLFVCLFPYPFIASLPATLPSSSSHSPQPSLKQMGHFISLSVIVWNGFMIKSPYIRSPNKTKIVLALSPCFLWFLLLVRFVFLRRVCTSLLHPGMPGLCVWQAVLLRNRG